MSVEYTIICDGCGALIDAGNSAAEARKAIREMGGRTALPGGKDLCHHCVAAGIGVEQPCA
jgi:hypothetical protein